jgi:hypothetical protein
MSRRQEVRIVGVLLSENFLDFTYQEVDSVHYQSVYNLLGDSVADVVASLEVADPQEPNSAN